MAGLSASKTRVNALMSRPSTSYLLPEKTWMPAQANLCSLRKLGCKRGHDAERLSSNNWNRVRIPD